WLRAQMYGRSSEKRQAPVPAEQGALFNEAEAVAATEPEQAVIIPAHTRKRGRKGLSSKLPRVEVVYDLAEDEKTCPHDGTPLKLFDRLVSEQLEHIPAKARVLQHVRLKYACPCCEQFVKTAPMPPQIL